MIATIKSKCLEELKMSRADEYDYDKFLEDSSDDHPKYADGLSDDCFEEKLVQDLTKSGSNDDSLERLSSTPSLDPYNRMTLQQREDLKISIHNVLELGQEGIKTMLEGDADRVIGEKSLKIVKQFLHELKDSNIELAKSDSD